MAAPKKTPLVPPSGDTLLFVGWPDKTVDAEELGIIQFDANAAATVTQAQADWLAEQIAAGALPEPKAAPGEPLPEVTGTGTSEEKQADLNACNKQLFASWDSK